MLKNDMLEQWDRENFFPPSTHLAQHARGESPTRVIKTAKGSHITDRDGNRLLDGFAGLYCVNAGYGREEITDAIAERPDGGNEQADERQIGVTLGNDGTASVCLREMRGSVSFTATD